MSETDQPTNASRLPGTVFQQPWWLDAVAPGSWSEARVTQGERLVARMPYVLNKRLGLSMITMPPLTQTLGPWIESRAKTRDQLGEQKKRLTELIDQLPRFDYFSQRLPGTLKNWLPFHWRGFECSARCTYVLDDLSDEQLVWDRFASQLRRGIRKAKKRVQIRTDLGVERFLDLNELTFKRQGLALPYSREFIRRLDSACETQDARRIFFAEDAEGRLHAAAYIVWDDQTAYYLMGGADPGLRESAAQSLVLWEAIRFAAARGLTFDFEGSMIEAIEKFFRQFGAEQRSYFVIRGYSPRMRILRAMRSLTGRTAA